MLPDHEFLKVTSLAEVVDVLANESRDFKLMAGGTDVIFNMRGRLFEPEVLVSVSDVPEMQTVALTDDGALSLGAGCRLTDLENHPLVAGVTGLADGLRAVASRHVRNMATLGGNLNLDTRCWYTNQTEEWRAAKGPCLKTGVDVCHAIKNSPVCVALNASDTAPALIALHAEVELVSLHGSRLVPLAEYYTDDGIQHTVRRRDEIMLRVIVPATRDRMVYIKETARKGNDFAYATIAVSADGAGEQCSRITIVLGSLGTRPMILFNAAACAVSQGLDDEGIEAAVAAVRDELGVLTNLYTPAAYKSRIARSLVRDALQRLRRQEANP
jgi:4-hydroxybenzoyl-CoA reductase subunit beta